ncbi:peptidase [Pseudidiomarina salinarum]|uniref:Peptidase n=2 Tax=Pseudidiomarina salinarum TaxID=435908 RepID=A0A094IT78_9GAMM|nr:peptidase [Pseudidiomarina salinarum]RUO71591.1 oligopeptidase B [Pseudidiomarina salinarum]
MLALLLSACSGETPPQKSSAPVAEQRAYVVASPHGDREDPYYWLRDDARAAPEVIAYLEAENAYYDEYRAEYSELTQTLEQEIIGRIKQDDSSVPYIKGDYSYAVKYEEGNEYPIYTRTHLETGDEQIMLDVNLLAEGESFMQVGNLQVSPNQQLMAYMVDNTGRRQYQLHVRDLTTGETVDSGMAGLSASIAWAQDNETLFVIENDPQTLLSTRVLKHKIGNSPDAAELVYEEQDNTFYMWVNNSTDGEYIMINLDATLSDEVHVMDGSDLDAGFQVIAPRERNLKYGADHLDGRWIIRTDLNAPNYQIMQVAADQLGDKANWQPLVEHSSSVFIQDFTVFESHLALNERNDGLRQIRVIGWDDMDNSTTIAADEPVYAMYFERNPEQDTDTLRYTYTSLKTPAIVYAYDMKSGVRTVLKETEVPNYDASKYETARTWAPTADGVKVPVSLLYKKGFKPDGSAPLYQYAYGSYGSTSEPSFRSPVFSLVDRGFVYAIAHIRGGQEMGRDWYESGKLLNKKNTFTDYIAVTDHLVAEGYAHPDKVFGMGGSAGGLLMGAVANMAPEKYKGLMVHVPFVDVVTTMLDESIPLTTNEFDEWGNPKEKAYYDYMLSYSPYDQVSAQDYPALLVTTGLHDSQVQYFEPAKWVAKLRAHKTDANPLMMKTNMSAGHGGSSGRFSRLKETAEEYAFVLNLLEE